MDTEHRRTLVRAAEYVRMSTDHQQYSTANQSDAIRTYAAERGMEIVRTYADEGKSGLSLYMRSGLRRLLQDVQSRDADFTAIIVFDVSRWGRFQDSDESAYHEYICKLAGISVHYCAEQFENDGSPISTIVKSIKRVMAGEYSRELSVKVFAGQKRIVEQGYRLGALAGYGLRRTLVDQNGSLKCSLAKGEWKSIAYERILKEGQRPRARRRLHWRQHQLSTNITGRPLNEGRSVSRRGPLLGQLVIVSNRVAVPEKNAKARAGGLEVAVGAALKDKSGIWLGWSGKVATQTKIATQRVVHDEITYITFDLSREDHHEYYNGFTNRVLWPILHYRIDLAEFSRRDLSGYLRVNDHFARQLHEVLGPDDLVWVHDYHLMPLAKALRERGHKNRIGFFLHVPCPPPEILTALPHHERLIPSLCDYDLVGFQTGDDAFNFSRYLTRECGLHSHDFNFIVADRTVRIDVFPVGIETTDFAHLAQRSVRLPFVKRVISSLVGRALIIGVDRLDYSKGIPQRLSAFELFLQTQPEWRGKVTYLQIAPKSRTEIPEYADMEQVIGSAAGRINGAYGEADWTPIRYINRAYSHTTLAGLYRAARVGLVTPLRDGMNLVAKEYVAAQNPDDPGVLVLSRFAGAAHECKAALLVNPYDPDSVAAAIGQALSMPLAERRERHDSLFRELSHNDIKHWADRFLTALERAPMALNQLEQMPFVGS